MNARLQRGDILVGQFAVEPRVINLADFMFGRNDAVRQLAVGRDHQQAFGILIQPPGGHRAHRGIHRREQIHHGFLLFVARGGQHAGGLVEHHVADGLVIQRPAVQPDIVRLAADLHARVLRRPPSTVTRPARTIALISLLVPSPSSASSLSSRILLLKSSSSKPCRFMCFPLYSTTDGFAISRRAWRFFCQPTRFVFPLFSSSEWDEKCPPGRDVFKNCPDSGGRHGNIT